MKRTDSIHEAKLLGTSEFKRTLDSGSRKACLNEAKHGFVILIKQEARGFASVSGFSTSFLIRKNRQPKYIPLKISSTNCRLKSLKGVLDYESREIILSS
ncbi:MAG: hypothetical protein V3U87_02900, partial [Methylococcaceae bacterium]